jgi:hypothetical protein
VHANGQGVSFQRDVAPFLNKSCAAAVRCHGDKPTHSVNLDLRPNAAYQELVNHATSGRPGALRVVPGDPSKSFLVDKLKGRLAPDEGKAMPIDVDTGVPLPKDAAQEAFVDNVLVPWIAGGAPNN